MNELRNIMSKNLMRINGLTISIASELHEIGINTIEQLAESNPEELSKSLRIEFELAETFVSQAINTLREDKESKLVLGNKITSKYSMKTTAKRDREFEEN